MQAYSSILLCYPSVFPAQDRIQITVGYEEVNFIFPELLGRELPHHLKNAVPKRINEYQIGRICAEEALKSLLNSQSPIKIESEDRKPIWPSGIIGSITHTHGLCSVLVEKVGKHQSIGLDIELKIAESTATKIWKEVLSDFEMIYFKSIQEKLDFSDFLTLVFSAKESIYKCLNPITGVYFGFEDAELIEINFHLETMQFRLKKTLTPQFPANSILDGKFKKSDYANRVFFETLFTV